jgi:hypothetical protein
MSTIGLRRRVRTLGLVAAILVALSQLLGAPSASRAAKQEIRKAFAQLPPTFIPNAGQIDPRVRFYARGPQYSFAFGRGDVSLSFARKSERVALGLRFLNTTGKVLPAGELQQPGRVNYFLGNDPTRWHSNLPTYGRVVYRNLWPGVDMAFKGAAGRLEYELVVHPGARASDIRLAYRGAGGVSLDKHGNLAIRTRFGVLTDTRPRSYELADGRRIPIASRFVLGGRGRFGFEVGSYDASRTLVIDPGLVYSTYLGGSSDDNGFGIALDAAGDAYVTGFTASSNFPTTAGAFDTSFNGGQDVFVTKLNPAGTSALYSTYIGGSSNDQGLAIAVDASGNAYVTGFTGSTNFPIRADTSQIPPGSFVYRSTYQGGSTDAFVTKLNASGSALVFSTFAGGSGADEGWGINVHSSGDV